MNRPQRALEPCYSAPSVFPNHPDVETPEATPCPAFEAWPITIELGFRGIFVPPGVKSHKTTCPECSRFRGKAVEACLSVRITSAWSAEVRCYHCGDGWQEVVAK